MSNFTVVDGDIRLTTSGGGQLLHTDDQNRLKVVMDMEYVAHTLSGTDHIGQLSDNQVMSSNIVQHESFINHNNLTNYSVDEHRTINDGGVTSTDLWSASKISLEITSSSGTTNHSELDQLDYASSGHTGFSQDSHLHDDRYYTETELDSGQLDDRYYTEPEVDTISGSLSTEIDSNISTHASSLDHDDRYYTESEVDALTWTESDIVDLDKYTQVEITTISGNIVSQISSDFYSQSEVDGLIPSDFYSQAEITTISGNIVSQLHTQGTDTTLGTMTADIDMDGSYQIVGLQAPAAAGEALRQTTNITEADLEQLTDGSETTLHSHAGSGGTTISGMVDNTIVRGDGTDSVQSTGITISDTDDVTLPATSSLTCPEKLVIPLDEPSSLSDGCLWVA